MCPVLAGAVAATLLALAAGGLLPRAGTGAGALVLLLRLLLLLLAAELALPTRAARLCIGPPPAWQSLPPA